MSSILLGVILLGGGTALSVFGLVLVRRFFKVDELQAHHEVAGYMLSILGTLYAVVLGFVVVSASNDVADAKHNIGSEVNAILDINRMADGFPKDRREKISQALTNYCDAVVNEEWQGMDSFIISPKTVQAGSALWTAIKNTQPVSPKEQALYGTLLENYTKMVDARRMRLVTAHGGIPLPLWVVLVVGAITTIGFTYFFGVEKFGYQVVMTSLVTITLLLNLYLVIVNSHPFSGEFRIRPIAYILAKALIQTGDTVPDVAGKHPPMF